MLYSQGDVTLQHLSFPHWPKLSHSHLPNSVRPLSAGSKAPAMARHMDCYRDLTSPSTESQHELRTYSVADHSSLPSCFQSQVTSAIMHLQPLVYITVTSVQWTSLKSCAVELTRPLQEL